MTAILYRGGLVADVAAGACTQADIRIEGERIIAVGPGLAADGATIRDASGRLILPGLINAHTHSHASLMRGVADRWTLEISLVHGPHMGGQRDDAAVAIATRLAAAEMVSTGTTACFDLFYQFPLPTLSGVMAAARSYAEVGMRAVIAPMVADRSLFQAIPGLLDSLPPTLRDAVQSASLPPAEATLAALEDIAQHRHALPPGVELALAPTIPHHCSDGFLAGCLDIARRHDLALHMHIAESRLQAAAAQQIYRSSLVAAVASRGLLARPFTAAHAIWLEPGDIDLLAKAGACVAHLPASNMRLGSGAAFVRPVLDRGVTVALGTDGANSADALDMFDAMRMASLTSRLMDAPRDCWLAAADVLRMATLGGAAALRRTGELGEIAPGRAADLVMLDLGHFTFQPLNDTLNQVVTGQPAAAVIEVMIAGRLVVEHGRLLTVDLPRLRADVARVSGALTAATAPARQLAERLEPQIAAFARAAEHGTTTHFIPVGRC